MVCRLDKAAAALGTAVVVVGRRQSRWLRIAGGFAVSRRFVNSFGVTANRGTQEARADCLRISSRRLGKRHREARRDQNATKLGLEIIGPFLFGRGRLGGED
jgi:hypothetical protein